MRLLLYTKILLFQGQNTRKNQKSKTVKLLSITLKGIQTNYFSSQARPTLQQIYERNFSNKYKYAQQSTEITVGTVTLRD